MQNAIGSGIISSVAFFSFVSAIIGIPLWLTDDIKKMNKFLFQVAVLSIIFGFGIFLTYL